MPYAALFSPDYFTARDLFRAAARAAGCDLEAHGISARGPGGEELTIDAAMLGPTGAATAVVVSSGLHGVEGPLGSAVQLALLERLAGKGDESHLPRSGPEGASHKWDLSPFPPGLRLVLLHGLNPYGFAWQRRWNEDNVDLNRNWLRPGEPFRGSPPLYARLNPVFNPASPPGPAGLFRLRILLAAGRFGLGAIRRTLPVGQYDWPRGLFFGGQRPAETQEIVRGQLARWVGGAGEVLHLDFHTGLGRWATYKLLVDAAGDSPQAAWLRARFGADCVSAVGSASGPAAYAARGSWGAWCEHAMPGRAYRFATAEFGTYGPLRILAALATENRAHFHCAPGDPRLRRARRELAEVFVPASPKWRDRVVQQGVAVVERAMGRG